MSLGPYGRLFALSAVAVIVGCSESRIGGNDSQSEFWRRTTELCGHQLPGQVYEVPDGDVFSVVSLSVTRCRKNRIEADLVVNGTIREIWILSRERSGMTLEHRDFALGRDKMLIYGGATEDEGLGWEQVFPANEATKGLLDAFRTNVWRISFEADRQLIYRLDRASKSPFFELRFDLSSVQSSSLE